MAKKQMRRTISFNRRLYELVGKAARAKRISAAQWATEAIAAALKASGLKPPRTVHMDWLDVQVASANNPTHQRSRGGRKALEQRNQKLRGLVAGLRREWGMT